jgi:general stress protein YciG
MAGTVLGGRKAAATNKQRYGLNFYEQIGRKGGKISRGGGFAITLFTEGPHKGMTGRELAQEAGARGGHNSRRGSSQSL